MKQFFKRIFCRHSYAIVDKFIAPSGVVLGQVCAGCGKYHISPIYPVDPLPDVQFGPKAKDQT